MALARDTDAVRDASRPLAQPASVATPSIRRRTLKDGLLAKSHLRRCHPPPPAVQERRERAAKARRNQGGSLRARPHATRIMREKTPFEHFRSGARRDKGWHATRACFFTPKTC
jgi:hypothetical protein